MGNVLPSFKVLLSAITGSKYSNAGPKSRNDGSFEKETKVVCQTTRNSWPAYKTAARHLKGILSRSAILFEKDSHKQQMLVKAQQELSRQNVYIYCTKDDAKLLKSKMEINEITYGTDQTPLIVLQASSDIKTFGSTKGSEAQSWSIHLKDPPREDLFKEGIREDDIWSAFNDIIERYAFHVASDFLKDINTCTDSLVDEGRIQERRYGLIQEIEALYQRSLIPEDEKVVFAQGPMLNVSHEVLMDLQDIPGVIATEVRTNELIIDISSSMQNTKGLSAQIDSCLQRNSKKIEYKIQTFSLKPFASYMCGQKVSAADGIKFGTLGGFFESKGNRIHAVLSKHVVEQLQSEMIVLNNKEICEIPPVVHDHPDIAIANVLEKFNAQCQTLFPNDDFKFVPGKLWLKGVTSLVGLDVFIWGATSRPGYGLIKSTVCYLQMDHFVITDSTDTPFCKEGDSGAIVCAEQREGGYIYIVAMVIGEYKKKKDTPSQYLALPLKEGLEKLREEYGVDFSILG